MKLQIVLRTRNTLWIEENSIGILWNEIQFGLQGNHSTIKIPFD